MRQTPGDSMLFKRELARLQKLFNVLSLFNVGKHLPSWFFSCDSFCSLVHRNLQLFLLWIPPYLCCLQIVSLAWEPALIWRQKTPNYPYPDYFCCIVEFQWIFHLFFCTAPEKGAAADVEGAEPAKDADPVLKGPRLRDRMLCTLATYHTIAPRMAQ